jgi:Ca-activated chloride channel family protein
MLQTWFAHPGLLTLALAAPVCSAFMLYAHLRRRQMLARLGSSLFLRKSVLVRPGVRRWKGFCVWLAVTLLALACAGPQLGLDKSAQFRTGRDVILVLDLSRSMTAEQPSRRELAVRALHDLANRFQADGGNRIALVGFAARPRLFFPLTQDYDHLRHTLAQIRMDDYPPLSVENAVSGTRIGAGLKLALASFDPRRANRPVIVLVSDGDDPVNDREWQQAVESAKEQNVRIHTVGVGSPTEEATIPAGRDVLTFNGNPVTTKLNEQVLRDIAAGTGGTYLPAQRDDYKLGAVVQQLLDADELRDEPAIDAGLPIYQLQYVWFLLPGVLLMMLTMLWNEGPRPVALPEKPRRSLSARRQVAAALLIVAALASISAAEPPDADSHVRLGNAAFAREDYQAALGHYEKAEALTGDPGQVSFNKAAAHYRLGQYKEAIECYRRTLADADAPPERKARAHYDLGNALQQHASDGLTELTEAVKEYRQCLAHDNLDPALRASARHNLELAQIRWLKARKDPRNAEHIKDEEKSEPKYPDPKKKETEYVQVKMKADDKVKEEDGAPEATKGDSVRSTGTPFNIEDKERVVPASTEDTLATLRQHAERIAEARRRQRNPDGPAAVASKDW